MGSAPAAVLRKRLAAAALAAALAMSALAAGAYAVLMEEMQMVILGRKMKAEQEMSDLAFGGSSLSIDGLGLTEFSFFCYYESGSEGLYNAVNGDSGHAYGAYQFDNRHELQDFLKYCYDQDPFAYAAFSPYLTCSQDSLQGSAGLAAAWRQAYAANPSGFSQLQDEYVMETKLAPVIAYHAKRGLDLSSRPMVIQGLCVSIHNRKGWETEPGYSIIEKSGVTDSTPDEEFISRLCEAFGAKCPGEINQRYNVDYSGPACGTICEKNMALNILHGEYKVTSGTEGMECYNDVPYYRQTEWAHVPYNKPGRNVATSGCGICSFSMVASWTLGRAVTPEETAPWAMANDANTVTNWGAFAKLAKHWGCHLVGQYDGPKFGGNASRISSALQQGYVIIASHTGGYFNPKNTGHYVVFTGITAEGKITANDPASRERSGVPVDFSTATMNCKQIWIFSKT